MAEKVRALLKPLAHTGNSAGFGVPDGHYEVWSGEDVQFAELNSFGFVQVAGRPQYREQVVVVAFKFGSLVRRDGVFHGEFVEPELLGHGGHLLLGGTIQPDPSHAAVFREHLKRLFEVMRGGSADAVYIYGVVDNGHWLNATAWLR
ncbi:hypothetical protein D3C73_1364390 [compost metagenome]